MVHNAKYKITHIPPEYYFPLIYDCPLLIACIRMLFRDYEKDYGPYFTSKRINGDPEKDVQVFKGITTDKVKEELCRYISQNRIKMDIDDAVQEDGNLECVALLYGYYNLFYYALKNAKLLALEKYIDEHRSTFDYLGECHVIMPQFKNSYEYAYSKSKRIPKDYDSIKKIIFMNMQKTLQLTAVTTNLNLCFSLFFIIPTSIA